jgi:hypothetical protein
MNYDHCHCFSIDLKNAKKKKKKTKFSLMGGSMGDLTQAQPSLDPYPRWAQESYV